MLGVAVTQEEPDASPTVGTALFVCLYCHIAQELEPVNTDETIPIAVFESLEITS